MTNYIILIIKLIPPFGILDIGNGKTCLAGKSRLEVKAKAIEKCASPFGCLMKP